MDATTARRRIDGASSYRCFISVSNETGAGPCVAVKDMVDVAGLPTTGGGRLIPYPVPVSDAAVVRRVRESGALIIGKTNLHEYGLGVTGANPHFGSVRNPRDAQRIAGGSSSGSAAAVALGLCDWAIGTDTGGSIRIPAALCGVVGIKPTTGLVDLTGVVPLSPTLDTVGPIAADVLSAAGAFEVLAGRGGLAPTSPLPDPRDLRLAYPADWAVGLDPTVARSWVACTQDLPTVDLPALSRFGGVVRDILFYEAAAYHDATMRERPDDYGDDVRASLLAGQAVTTARYERALSAQERLTREVDDALKGWDAIVVPTCGGVARRSGAPISTPDLVRFTNPFNLCGNPVVSLPMPVSGPLPAGIQVVGRAGRDAQVIEVAAALERSWSAERLAGEGAD